MPSPRKVRPVRNQGEWTAQVDGRRLAVLHNVWWKPPNDYFDPMEGAKLDGKKYAALTAALRENDVALMQDSKADGSFRSKGYVGMFQYEGLSFGADGSISLKIVKRLPIAI